ncbi:MAG: helix-turn-helix transcriptional regulator [Hydrogenophilaceae bacterium]|jgi:DNA-binding transcriptional ArsR family regulator|nr:helix-turn-helix transcriptional regulator [Hydrogenophilaceae bacterium]
MPVGSGRALRAKPKKPAPRKAPSRAIEALEPRATEAARLLKLLANEQRLTVLCRLSGGEMSVGELGRYVPLSQSALSQHLAKMRADGLVATRRDAQTIYYRLADPITERLIGLLCELYGGPD